MLQKLLLSMLLLLFKIGFTQTAGEVAANAKKIDADKFHYFRSGSAMIKKGNAYALIDKNGSFVVPFNTYKRIYFGEREDEHYPISQVRPRMTGIYFVYSPKLKDGGIINAAGKLLYSVPLDHGFLDERTGFNDNDLAYARLYFAKPTDKYRKFKDFFLTAKGNIIFLPDLSWAKWNEDIASYRDYDTKKHGFKNLKGETIIAAQYDAASVFSEGLAAVAKKNEFGEYKWGFIDTKGKVVIPFKYSFQPGDFGNGLASVTPTAVEDFKFAFINKQGEMVLKIPVNSPVTSGHSSTPSVLWMDLPRFQDGYFISFKASLTSSYNYILDTTGNVYKANELFNLFDLPTTYEIQTFPFYNQQMVFAKRCVSGDCKKGILDFKTKTYVPPLFDDVSFFDPVSNLAYAKILLHHDQATGKKTYREGYINKQGVFVIVKAEPDKF